jgi:hypothetical protein
VPGGPQKRDGIVSAGIVIGCGRSRPVGLVACVIPRR